ncbi:hypothetical protein DFP73DRAFT_541473 [Morchella snyderi]|nr:hypothetical protein DFP73DRAFT_541473 [Morchella snyderi]
MTSYSSSLSTPYQRPKHGFIESTSSKNTEIPTGPSVSRELFGPHKSSTSAVQRRHRFLDLHKFIGNALGELQSSFGFNPSPPFEPLMANGEIAEYLGRGRTFYVSRLSLPATIGLKGSWPKTLLVQPAVRTSGQRANDDVSITCKRPMIEFDIFGNPKQGKVEERLEAVFLEIRVLTHPAIYLHKNVVDFLGISWQCELPEIEPGQKEFLPPKQIPVILLEYAKHGTLADFLQTDLYASMTFNARANLCRDIAQGLAVLHKNKIVHGDLKPDNVLIFEDSESGLNLAKTGGVRAKLADFGFSVGYSTREEIYTLRGRTWPWNDPEWDASHTWSQLEKTDVFSYGLLAWTILSKRDIGQLFDLDGNDYDRNDPELREQVERLKDWTLSLNASIYFKGNSDATQVLAQSIFQFALEPSVDRRAQIHDIVQIWDIWFSGDGPYQPRSPWGEIHPGMDLPKVHGNVTFERILCLTKDFPHSYKREFTEVYLDSTLDPNERCQTTVSKAFSLMMGWTTSQDFIEAKRLIDESALMAPQISILQPMFFESKEPRCFLSASHGICTDYEQQVFLGLMATVKNTNSYEAFRQLMRYFPMPEGFSYSRLRSIAYRKLMYGIKEIVYPDELFDLKELDEAAAGQMADIENYYLEGNALALDHSPLHYAVCSGFPEAVSLMLQSEDFQEELLENVDGLGFTPLLSACRLGSYKIAKLLIYAGASVRARTEHGETILHFLTEFENADEMCEIAELIMERGGLELVNTICTDHSFPNEYMSVMIHLIGPPLNTAIMRGNLPLVEILLKYRADPCQGMPQFKALSEYGRQPQMTGVNNGSPLQTAAASHSYEVLRVFWEAFPWSQEWEEWTNGRLLHLAIDGFAEFQKQYIHGPLRRRMMVDTINFLLDRMYHLKAPMRINGGMPVIFFATERGTASTLEHLLLQTNSLDINTYFDGLAPIHVAVRRGLNDIFNVLIKYGANPHLGIIKKPVASTLSYCCTCQDSTKEMLKYLLERGVGKQDDGRYPDTLTHAVAAGKLQEASMILAAGANVDELTTEGEGWTTLGLLVRACTYNSIALMSFLVDHEFALGRKPAGFMAVPSLGWTVLHVIAFTPHTSPFYDRTIMSNILDYILNKFASPENLNAQDHKGWTALHHAAANANSIVLRRLLALDGIDVALRTSDGESLSGYELSQRRAATGISEVVQCAGARAVKIYTKEINETIALLEPFHEC